MTKRIWILGALSNEMFHVENLLTEENEPFIYARVFLSNFGLTDHVSQENAQSIIDAYADAGILVPQRVYFIECADRLESPKEPPVFISFSAPDIVRQVIDELARLRRL